MPITKSEIISNTLQSDGTKRVQVIFTDHLHFEHHRSYDFYKSVNVNKAVGDRQANIENGLKIQEIELAVKAVESGKKITLNWATWDEVKVFLQERETEKQKEITQATDEKQNITDKITEIGVG